MHDSRNTYYVATLARYVLVTAGDEAQARADGQAALEALYRERFGRVIPVTVTTVRPAADDEIELQRWHAEMLARESSTAN